MLLFAKKRGRGECYFIFFDYLCHCIWEMLENKLVFPLQTYYEGVTMRFVF